MSLALLIGLKSLISISFYPSRPSWGTDRYPVRRALCPAEAVPAAHPLSQKSSTGTDHHPQLWSGLGLEPDERGNSPQTSFQNRAAAQKAHSRRLTPTLNGPVENSRGGWRRKMALSLSLKPTQCAISQIFSSHPCRCCGFMFAAGRCPSTFLTWTLNHLSERN